MPFVLFLGGNCGWRSGILGIKVILSSEWIDERGVGGREGFGGCFDAFYIGIPRNTHRLLNQQLVRRQNRILSLLLLCFEFGTQQLYHQENCLLDENGGWRGHSYYP